MASNTDNPSTYVAPVTVQDPTSGVTATTNEKGEDVIIDPSTLAVPVSYNDPSYDPSGYAPGSSYYQQGQEGAPDFGDNDYTHQLAANGGLMGAMHHYAMGGMPAEVGGLTAAHNSLGSYSDGGQLLRGPGDGVSDDIPAQIGHHQPARLADGEFVVPARIVSELGNGSTEAGARQLYAMLDRIQNGRHKSIGKGKVAVNSNAARHLPA
jgi:hypothetical protein